MFTSKQLRKIFRKLKREDRVNYNIVSNFIEYLNRICLHPNANDPYLDTDIANREILKFIHENKFPQNIIEILRISFKFFQNIDIGYNVPLQNDQIIT